METEGGGAVKIYKPEGRCNVSGEVVRETRERAGLSQEQLAARIQLAGLSITQKAISRATAWSRTTSSNIWPTLSASR